MRWSIWADAAASAGENRAREAVDLLRYDKTRSALGDEMASESANRISNSRFCEELDDAVELFSFPRASCAFISAIATALEISAR